MAKCVENWKRCDPFLSLYVSEDRPSALQGIAFAYRWDHAGRVIVCAQTQGYVLAEATQETLERGYAVAEELAQARYVGESGEPSWLSEGWAVLPPPTSSSDTAEEED